MEKHYQHILVPLDGSELAELALRDAIDLAELSHAKITLLQVISPIDHIIMTEAEYPIYVDQQWEAKRAFALQYLQDVAHRMNYPHNTIHLAVEMGPAADTILDYVSEYPIDIIVMATHGRTGLRRWLYGSVAEKVLHSAEIPVLMVRAHPEPVAL